MVLMQLEDRPTKMLALLRLENRMTTMLALALMQLENPLTKLLASMQLANRGKFWRRRLNEARYEFAHVPEDASIVACEVKWRRSPLSRAR